MSAGRCQRWIPFATCTVSAEPAAPPRHCEEPLRRSNPNCPPRKDSGLLCSARNDGGCGNGSRKSPANTRPFHRASLPPRHCEEPLRRSNPDCPPRKDSGLLRSARNDGGCGNGSRKSPTNTRPFHRASAASPSLRGALATKQSRLPPRKDSGLLRFARNDGGCGTTRHTPAAHTTSACDNALTPSLRGALAMKQSRLPSAERL
jgi:hypothetical protein